MLDLYLPECVVLAVHREALCDVAAVQLQLALPAASDDRDLVLLAGRRLSGMHILHQQLQTRSEKSGEQGRQPPQPGC